MPPFRPPRAALPRGSNSTAGRVLLPAPAAAVPAAIVVMAPSSPPASPGPNLQSQTALLLFASRDSDSSQKSELDSRALKARPLQPPPPTPPPALRCSFVSSPAASLLPPPTRSRKRVEYVEPEASLCRLVDMPSRVHPVAPAGQRSDWWSTMMSSRERRSARERGARPLPPRPPLLLPFFAVGVFPLSSKLLGCRFAVRLFLSTLHAGFVLLLSYRQTLKRHLNCGKFYSKLFFFVLCRFVSCRVAPFCFVYAAKVFQRARHGHVSRVWERDRLHRELLYTRDRPVLDVLVSPLRSCCPLPSPRLLLRPTLPVCCFYPVIPDGCHKIKTRTSFTIRRIVRQVPSLVSRTRSKQYVLL